jgi:hypothetical protein
MEFFCAFPLRRIYFGAMMAYGGITMEYINALLILAFIGFIAYAVFNGSSRILKNQKIKEESVSAKLSDKRIQENQSMRFGFGIQPARERYYLTFTMDDGSIVEFMVTREDFYAFEIGTRGKLYFQGMRYKGFESDTN